MMTKVINTVHYPLISGERTEKLDLLTHLIINSVQPLVLCGPKGIGKTKLLETLKDRKKNSWYCCSILADTNTTLDSILEQITSSTELHRVALLIDNAGLLSPGLITTIIEYALKNPLLRVVFVLTPDELFIKIRTDKLIDDCYFIEIPPLSEKQCGDYLRYLATQTWAKIPINAINESLVETVYRQTQGIPAHILNQLPKFSRVAKNRDYSLWWLILAVSILVFIALGMQWLSTNGYL